MEPKFQTSFIPKRPISSSTGNSVIRSTNIFSIVATVFFIVTLFTSVGLYLYKNLLTNQIAEVDKILNTSRTAFQPEKIQELVDVNNRIEVAKNLLEKHIVTSNLLTLLETLTVKRMRFVNFNYSNRAGIPTVVMKGESQTYNALAQQEDIFSKDKSLVNPEFSDFNLGDNGNITFDFSATLEPGLISYKKITESKSLNQ